MRVYEFAKLKGISSKEVLSLLGGAGFEVASHMVILTPEAHAFLEKKFSVKQPVTSNVTKDPVQQQKTVKKQTSSVPSTGPIVTQPSVTVPKKDDAAEKKIIKIDVSESLKAAPATPVAQATTSRPPLVAAKTVPVAATIAARPPSRFPSKKPTAGARSTGSRFARRHQSHAPRQQEVPVEITEILISGDLALGVVADLMGKNPSELILALLKRGVVSSHSSMLSTDIITSLAAGFGINVTRAAKQAVVEKTIARTTVAGQDRRWPIVVVIGHVDHGKTTLLDFLRKTNVVAREKGGITQHIGAYEVEASSGKVIFLDTPGHEAFATMRGRGVKMTDLAILVVAADDGVMPQTVEAIRQARAAGVSIIVAINKIDKVASPAQIEDVKRQLAEHDLLVEDWGGTTICVPLSAKTGQGISDLLDMILLQAQMMDLYADAKAPARAFVLESRLDRGFGPVATVICLEGTLKQGDYFTCGNVTGKIRLILNSYGDRIVQAGPSLPVQIIGFDKLAFPADVLLVVSAEGYNKARAGVKTEISAYHSPAAAITMGEKSDADAVKLLIKCDNFGSREALEGCITALTRKLKDAGRAVQIVHIGIGDISESDVMLADSTGAQIVGFHVKAERNAATLAKSKSVDVALYQVIYHLIEALEKLIKKPNKVKITVSKAGEAIVRKVFPLKDNTVIAGCQVINGIFARVGSVICFRDGKKVGEGRIASLQRERKSVKEVHNGFECGFITEDFHDWQVGDTVHYMMETKTMVAP